MAKWGEGDPRWIVEERPDATNVNNWHWTEKNATPWSKERLQELLQDFKIEHNNIACTIDGVESCIGEATVNNRKGKLIIFYEWELELKWSGRLLDKSETVHKGKIKVPNLSEENEMHEVDLVVTIDESNDESQLLKEFMYKSGRENVRKQLGLYVKELKEEYSKDLILPRKNDENTKSLPATSNNGHKNNSALNLKNERKTSNSSPQYLPTTNNTKDAKPNADSTNLDVRSIEMKVEFQCSANDLYDALTKVEMLTAFTHGSAKANAIEGGEFELYGGNIQGKFVKLEPQRQINQLWRLKSWPTGHYSKVYIKLSETKSNTLMTLIQSGIPAAEGDLMPTNWHRYYWQSIKQTFGFGSGLYGGL